MLKLYRVNTSFDSYIVKAANEERAKELAWLDDDVDVTDLARVMDVVQRLICTPVKERFPEKKYQLVVKRENPFCPKYVSNIITGFDELVFDLSKDEKEARIFSEKELNQIKKREPSLTPAIDAMKEPAEDKND